MDKKEFHRKLKYILAHIKHGKYDTPNQDIMDMLHNDVVAKSNGGWDNAVAAGEMKQIEWALDVQPEAVQLASKVKESDAVKALDFFLSKRGYKYSHIDEVNSKTPDGSIKGFGKRYICEIKSPVLKFDNKPAPFGYKFATSHRTILNFIHTAIKQFNQYDPNYELPRILIYTSAHSHLNWKSFTDSIQGGVVGQNGELLPDFRNTEIYKSTKGIVYDIDAYIWFQINGTKQFYQASYIFNTRSNHEKSVKELIINLNKEKISDMDNIIGLR